MNPRISSSLILLRETINNSFEVLMIRRMSGMQFSKALIFPGGCIEPSDETRSWRTILGCGTDMVNATIYSSSIDLTALRITAIRETWEETGVQLTNVPIQSKSKDFFSICHQNNIRPSIEKLYYFTRVIAPTKEPKRHDTTFFISIIPQQDIIVDNLETDYFLWGTPLMLLDLFRAGQATMWPPQIYILSQLCEYRNLSEVFSAVSEVKRYPMLFQMVYFEPNNFLSCLPGDYRHDFTPEKFKLEKHFHFLSANEHSIEIHQSAGIKEYLDSIIS
jgi:8-oxo-dGTP pyrophosphatase MutT (NUDIX family)